MLNNKFSGLGLKITIQTTFKMSNVSAINKLHGRYLKISKEAYYKAYYVYFFHFCFISSATIQLPLNL